MKLILILIAMMLTAPAWADEDAGSEATVVAQGFDPAKPDCKCQQPRQSTLPSDNRANDKQVVDWISNPDAGGAPPALGSTTTH